MHIQIPQITEIKGIRVLTTKQLAEKYGTNETTIRTNFSRNRTKFVEGKHYIALAGDELREFKNSVTQCNAVKNNDITKCNAVGTRTNLLYLWTEKGALLHAKSLNTDKAWEVYDCLVDFYFRAKETEKPVAKPEAKPERKPPMMTVVDAPENVQIQKAIKEVQKCLCAIDVLTVKANTYCTSEEYDRIMDCIDTLRRELGRRILNLKDIKPKQIQKMY